MTTPTFNFTPKPKATASFQIGGALGLRFNIQKKPRWLTSKLLLLLFEIETLPPLSEG